MGWRNAYGSSLSLHEEASPAEVEALRQAELAKQAQKKREVEDAQLEKLRQAKLAQATTA